jgi:transposase
MKYKKEERLDIGRQVYTGELSEYEAMIQYNIGRTCVQNYVRKYRESVGIPSGSPTRMSQMQKLTPEIDISAYQKMSKEELINELIKAKANELRAKKGYEVKGDGADKEFVPINNRNTKS